MSAAKDYELRRGDVKRAKKLRKHMREHIEHTKDSGDDVYLEFYATPREAQLIADALGIYASARSALKRRNRRIRK